MNLFTKQKETHKLGERIYSCKVWGVVGEGIAREFEIDMNTLLYLKWKTIKGLLVEHGELCSMLCGCLDGRRVWGRIDICICMAESFFCPPETITILLIGYTTKQNKKFNEKKNTRWASQSAKKKKKRN